MIAALDGSVLSLGTDNLVLMVQMVGYKVHITSRLLAELKPQMKIFFYIYTHVREDALLLFGFKTQEELALFELLLSVSGIGPKTALSIMDRDTLSIQQAILQENSKFFVGIPRLGTKNAQKLIIELKSKLKNIPTSSLGGLHDEVQELSQALQSVGFTKQESLEVIKNIPSDMVRFEDKLRFALKSLDNHQVRKL